MKCSYAELFWMIERIYSHQQHQHQNQYQKDLPAEITHKIASFCTVEPVDPSLVQVVRASSSSDQHPLSAALDDSHSTWWISRTGTMPRGRGQEFLELQLSTRVCRVRTFSIQIPPLPMGPLSVRRLRLERKQGDHWVPMSPIWTVENRTGWQDFTLDPPVDVQFVRVVCLSNQMAMILEQFENDDDDDNDHDQPRNHLISSVGFYSVKFI